MSGNSNIIAEFQFRVDSNNTNTEQLDKCPLYLEKLKEHQSNIAQNNYISETSTDDEGITYYKNKLFILKTNIESVIEWFHVSLYHPGANKLYNTLRDIVYSYNLQSPVKECTSKCDICQSSKVSKKYESLIFENKLYKLFKKIGIEIVRPFSTSYN